MRAAERIRIDGEVISRRERVFNEHLEAFRTKYLSLWRLTEEDDPELGERFDPAAQRRNEIETDELVHCIEEQCRRIPDAPADREVWRNRIVVRLKRFGRECFRFPAQYLDIIFSDPYLQVTAEFARRAESFGGELETAALSQALRNVWVMNCIQMFLGRTMSLSPSVFAYSMLYPYTDNLLDDERAARDFKREVCRKLGLRLAGAVVVPVGRHERDVYRLVAMIEDEYDRAMFPEVFWVLLAIHRGQVKSILQQSPGYPPDEEEILGISVEKGGASVLADGYLVAGRLRWVEAGFFFGLGVLLQLMDDLQDVSQDLEARRWTLFSSRAHQMPLDGITSRLHGFLLNLLRPAAQMMVSAHPVLADLIRRNCTFLLLQAVSQNPELFDRRYLRRLEPYSPVRFEYLKTLRRILSERHEALKKDVLDRRRLPSFYHLLA
jgi:hypothetical protein